MTTRKHFVACAAALAEIKNKAQRMTAAKAMANLYAKDNPRFNRKKFLTACGVTT